MEIVVLLLSELLFYEVLFQRRSGRLMTDSSGTSVYVIAHPA